METLELLNKQLMKTKSIIGDKCNIEIMILHQKYQKEAPVNKVCIIFIHYTCKNM